VHRALQLLCREVRTCLCCPSSSFVNAAGVGLTVDGSDGGAADVYDGRRA
jgi:hypothetical protein